MHQDGINRVWRDLDEHETDLPDLELIRHLQLELHDWELTNLRRFVGLIGTVKDCRGEFGMMAAATLRSAERCGRTALPGAADYCR